MIQTRHREKEVLNNDDDDIYLNLHLKYFQVASLLALLS